MDKTPQPLETLAGKSFIIIVFKADSHDRPHSRPSEEWRGPRQQRGRGSARSLAAGPGLRAFRRGWERAGWRDGALPLPASASQGPRHPVDTGGPQASPASGLRGKPAELRPPLRGAAWPEAAGAQAAEGTGGRPETSPGNGLRRRKDFTINLKTSLLTGNLQMLMK